MVANELIFYSEIQGSNEFGTLIAINYIANDKDILVGDFTGDGANDIVYIKDNILYRGILFQNVSNGFFFQSQTFDAPNIQSVGQGDFDGNGMPDLAFDAYRGNERIGITFNFFTNMAGFSESVLAIK